MIYYKIIDGQEVFNNGTSLKINERWTSNPTPEMYEAEGWMPYTTPPFVPQPQDEPDYYDVMEAVKKMFSTDTEEMSDEDALAVAALYPTWRSQIGKQVVVGARLWDDGKLWKVIQSHIVQEDWRPADAVSLFTEVSIEEFPEWHQPSGSTDAYMIGDKVSYNNKHYESTSDYNVWPPDGGFGWKEV